MSSPVTKAVGFQGFRNFVPKRALPLLMVKDRRGGPSGRAGRLLRKPRKVSYRGQPALAENARAPLEYVPVPTAFSLLSQTKICQSAIRVVGIAINYHDFIDISCFVARTCQPS